MTHEAKLEGGRIVSREPKAANDEIEVVDNELRALVDSCWDDVLSLCRRQMCDPNKTLAKDISRVVREFGHMQNLLRAVLRMGVP